MEKQPRASKTRWHCLLGKLLEELLTPVGISVYTESSVMSEPPKTDILLLRREMSEWSPEQAARLPDGIRDSSAGHILLEFKYTESVNENAIRQALCYDFFYKRVRKLRAHEVATFLISSKTPGKATLERNDYSATDQKGVYRSRNNLLKEIPMLILNELSDEMHNAFVKCFASRRKAKLSAFGTLERNEMTSFGSQLTLMMNGLMHFWLGMEGDDMKEELTPEKVMEIGRMFKKIVLSDLSEDDILAAYGRERLLRRFTPEERLTGLKPEERLTGLKPEERLTGLKPEERLTGLSIKEIEDYLKKLKRKHRHDN
jgi:hypothetical protein